MKRYIRTSEYITKDVLFDSTITVNIDIDVPVLDVVDSSTSQMSKFPGMDKFREDVADILEQEYGFEVIKEKSHNMQRGYVTNRPEEISASVYFNCYYDLSNAQRALDNLGVKLVKAPEPDKVFCFIHIRFSEHYLNDEGDVLHRQWVADNASKYVKENPKVNYVEDDEEVVLTEKMLHQYYNEALIDLRDKLESNILTWVKHAARCKKLNFNSDDED